ncbi:MAG: hypothetical protein ACKOBM_06155, partial [Gammaproteobacteria bacterium]
MADIPDSEFDPFADSFPGTGVPDDLSGDVSGDFSGEGSGAAFDTEEPSRSFEPLNGAMPPEWANRRSTNVAVLKIPPHSVD